MVARSAGAERSRSRRRSHQPFEEEGGRPTEPPEQPAVAPASQELGKAPVAGATATRVRVVGAKDERTAPAWTHPDTPGLALTRLDNGKWTVTHERSGYRIGTGYQSAHAAMQTARKLAPIADWTEDWRNAPPSKLAESPAGSDERSRRWKAGRVEFGARQHEGVPMEPPTAPRTAEVPLEPERREGASGITREAESGRLPAEEVQADESERERPARSDLRTESLGEAGEGSLETVPPEDVRGAGEERPAARDGGEGSGADRARPDEYGESGLSARRGVGSGEGEVSVPSDRGGRTDPGPKPGQLTTGNRPQNDYRITDADAIGSGGERTKYRANVAAIRLLKQLELEGRLATPEEQQTLVKYVGWGGIAPNQLFNERTQGGKRWADQYQEIKSLLTPDEYNRARASTTNAHYTSAPVVSAIWDALQRMGFAEGKMLEPGAGIGGFLGLMPPELSANTRSDVRLCGAMLSTFPLLTLFLQFVDARLLVLSIAAYTVLQAISQIPAMIVSVVLIWGINDFRDVFFKRLMLAAMAVFNLGMLIALHGDEPSPVVAAASITFPIASSLYDIINIGASRGPLSRCPAIARLPWP